MPDAKAIRFFNEVAAEWETMRSRMYGTGLRDKILNAADVRPGQLVADVGCGSGFLALELLRRGVRVVAADASSEMLAEVRQRAPAASRLELRLVSKETLPLGDSEVDAAVANMYLHHVGDPPAAIREMARVVRPGGRVVLGDLAAHTHKSLEKDHHDRWLGFAQDDLRRWFSQAGLEDVHVGPAQETCSSLSCAGDGIDIAVLMASGRRPAGRP